MKLYVMRHGPAEDQAASGRDFDRALTESGRERTRLVAVELGRRDEAPRRIVSSPLVRALETARIVAETLRVEAPVEVRGELAPGGDAAGLVRELVAAGAKRVMFVGHEPDVSTLTAHLLGSFGAGFEKSMVVGVKLGDGKPPIRRFVLEPRSLSWQQG